MDMAILFQTLYSLFSGRGSIKLVPLYNPEIKADIRYYY